MIDQVFEKCKRKFEKRAGNLPALSRESLLLDGDLPALGDHLALLGQGQLQHAVIIGGGDVFLLDAGDVKGALVAAAAALPAQVLALLLLFGGLLVLGGDGENAVLQVQVDVALIKAGQISLQQVVVALVLDVGAEGGSWRWLAGNMERSNSSNRSLKLLLIRPKGIMLYIIKTPFGPMGSGLYLLPGPSEL